MKASDALNGKPPLKGPIMMEVTINRKVPKWSRRKTKAALAGMIFPVTRPDWDNCCKQLCDGMNGIVYDDDSQIVTSVVNKRYANHDYVEVEIREIGFYE